MISIIAAVAKNRVIGNSGALPWYIPEDLKRFKALTTGNIVIMGRKTFESILARIAKPLPNRLNIVITSDREYVVPEGVEKFITPTEALHNINTNLDPQNQSEIFFIGGSRIYDEGVKIADTMYLTELKKDYEGDTFFPEFNSEEWDKEIQESHPEFDFVKYTRK